MGRLLPLHRAALLAVALTAPTTLTAQPRLVIQRSHSGMITAAAFQPDGKLLATGATDGRIKLWNPGTGRLVLTLNGRGRITGLAFTPDGRRLGASEVNGVGNGRNVSEQILSLAPRVP